MNGRKITFISYDDAYSPPKTVEMTRKLVEQDKVLVDRQPARHPDQQRDLALPEPKKVPQLFVATGATKWDDPKGHPWTIGWQPNYQSEGRIYAAYILKNKPDAQDRRALPERRFRQGLPEGRHRRARRKAASMIKVKATLRDHRPDRRLADGRA